MQKSAKPEASSPGQVASRRAGWERKQDYFSLDLMGAFPCLRRKR